MQQALTIWSTPCQLLAKDPTPQFRDLARPQNPQSMYSSSISECCLVNSDVSTRIQRQPVGRVSSLCHNCATCCQSEGFRSAGVFLKVAYQRKGLQGTPIKRIGMILGRQGTKDPWCQKSIYRYGIKKKDFLRPRT